MPTRNIVLGEHPRNFVEGLMRSGLEQHVSEVLRKDFRLIQTHEYREAAKLQALQQAADRGWVEIAAGRYTDVASDQFDDFIAQLGHTTRVDRQIWSDMDSRQ